MQWQLSYLKREQGYSSDSGVIYVDLPSNELISMMMVSFYVTNAATVLHDRSILDVVKKVTVQLDGAKVAYDCQPEVGSFLAFAQSGDMPPHELVDNVSVGAYMNLPIYFGRFPKDPDYMLDTGRYSTQQLQVEYELNTTYEATGTAKLTCWFLRPLVRPGIRGFIRSRIVHDYTTTGSAETKTIDLPHTLPWLRVGARVFDIDANLIDVVTDLKLDIDQGRLRLFDGRVEDLLFLNQLDKGAFIAGPAMVGLASNADTPHVHMGVIDHLNIQQYNATAEWFGYDAKTGHQVTLNLFDAAGADSATDRVYTAQVIGKAPFGCLDIGNFAEEPFPAGSYGDALVEYTIGAYSAQIQTYLQEVVEGAL